MERFTDRQAAGRMLAGELREYADTDTVVLGLTRGGLIVAYEIAHLLHLPLEVLVVQRIAEPEEPHLSLGALAEPGHLVVSRRRLRALTLPAGWLRQSVTDGLRVLDQRCALYHGTRGRRELSGRRVIIVNDAAATGATMLVAVKAVRSLGAREIVVALPVAPEHVVQRLQSQVERVVCPARPADLIVLGIHYPAPLEASDEMVRALLHAAELPDGVERRRV